VSPVQHLPQARAFQDIRAIIFDVDGVIADTARLQEIAWRRLTLREGLPFDEHTAQALRGLSREASLRRILGDQRAEPDRFMKMMERKNADYVALVGQLTPVDVLPGVVSLLRSLRGLGLEAAACSASRNARLVLDRLGLTHSFNCIVDGIDEAGAKSGLHRFLLASAAMRVEPAHCVAVEDSTAGLSAARQFGMKSIGIGDSETLSTATFVVDSLSSLNALQILDKLTRRALNAG